MQSENLLEVVYRVTQKGIHISMLPLLKNSSVVGTIKCSVLIPIEYTHVISHLQKCIVCLCVCVCSQRRLESSNFPFPVSRYALHKSEIPYRVNAKIIY